MSAREQMLSRIRQALASRPTLVQAAPAPQPSRSHAARAADPGVFTARAEIASCTVERVRGPAAVPEAVARYAHSRGAAARTTILDEAVWNRYPWGRAPDMRWSRGPLAADGELLVTGCEAAIAEEGAVVLAGDGRAAAAPFLALDHVVIVEAHQLVPSLASLWPLLRGRYAGARWARHLTVILGPSRTADLGVPSRLGAHGPAAVHIVLVAEDRVASGPET